MCFIADSLTLVHDEQLLSLASHRSPISEVLPQTTPCCRSSFLFSGRPGPPLLDERKDEREGTSDAGVNKFVGQT